MLGYMEKYGFVCRQQVLLCLPIFPLCTDSHEANTMKQMPTLPTMQLIRLHAASSGATKRLYTTFFTYAVVLPKTCKYT